MTAYSNIRFAAPPRQTQAVVTGITPFPASVRRESNHARTHAISLVLHGAAPFCRTLAAAVTAAPVIIAWLALLLAGLLEVVWALTLKLSDGVTRFWPTLAMLL